MKEEPKANDSDSFKVGYHMAMGNYHRNKGEKDKAYRHDQKLDRCIKNIGQYSGMDKSEFEAGAEHAVSRISKGENDSNCGCEEERDQYEDEREKMIDEQEQDKADKGKEKDKEKEIDKEPKSDDDSEKKDSRGNDVEKQEGEGTNPPPPPSSPRSTPSTPTAKVPDYAKSENWEEIEGQLSTKPQRDSWTLSKGEMQSRCPDCGGLEFIGEKFAGCICMGDMRNSKLRVVKNEKGDYELKFGKGWDKENIELLLEILRRRNNG
jgi:hypothetical protein